MTFLSVDFETRSTVDLRKTGVHPYAVHPTTDVICMAWAFEGEEVQVWLPPQPFPERIAEHITAGGRMRAHNAQFERLLWQGVMAPRYGAPPVALEQWECSAAEAAAMALPRSLEQVAQVLGVAVQKDMAGHRLMLQMCKPRSTKGGRVVWWDAPEKVERLAAYCANDVRAEMAVSKALRRLGPTERQVYLLDQRMNDRGVGFDRALAKASLVIVDEGLERANREIEALTEGRVRGATKTTQLRQYLGVESVSKDAVAGLLAGDLAGEHRRVLELRAEVGRSSVAKLKRMIEWASEDDRLRGGFLYHGASTGRWSGRGYQPQNLPRPEIKDVERFIPLLLQRDYDVLDLYAPPVKIVSSALRAHLVATPGKVLVAADYAQIEARVNAWLAGQEDLISLFASGGKIYEEFAAVVFKVVAASIAKDSQERQLGKAGILGCGFQMGWKKFKATAARAPYFLDVSDELAQEVVKAYRSRFPAIRRFWYALDDAALDAVRSPGAVFRAGAEGRVQYAKRGAYLWCILPSGRPLAYPNPRIETRTVTVEKVRDDGTVYEETFEREQVLAWGVDSLTKRWSRFALYGGLLCENVVQATARDLMADAMLRVEATGVYDVVATVHDEVVAEAPPTVVLSDFEQLMAHVPAWAAGCPVAVEGWVGPRYRK